MNRIQRRTHAYLWPVVSLVLIAISATALIAKNDVERAARQAEAGQID